MHTYTAGCRVATVEGLEDPIPVVVLYPADAPETRAVLGRYVVEVAMDAPVAEGRFPLVLVSHGTGGSHLGYRTLAQYLARRGFVVALVEHPRNNRNNDELGGTATILANRPRHVRAVIDWAFEAENLGASLCRDGVAVVGHSLGGYTALAIAGGVPTAFPNEAPLEGERRVQVVPDERVKALALLAPATVWFKSAGALDAVRVPVLMLTAEKDPHTPPLHAEIVRRGLPDASLLSHRVVPNAGHFSFLSPFPEEMTSPSFPPSQDPPGFDRAGFHEEMNAEILGFLQRVYSA